MERTNAARKKTGVAVLSVASNSLLIIMQDRHRPAHRVGGGHLRGHPFRYRPRRRRDRPLRRPRLQPRCGRATSLRSRQGREHLRDHRGPADLRGRRLDHLRSGAEAHRSHGDRHALLGRRGHARVGAGQHLRLQPSVQGGQGDRLRGSAGGRLAPAHRRLHLGRRHGRTAGDLDSEADLVRSICSGSTRWWPSWWR